MGQKKVFLGLCPKLWVGGAQESQTFGEVLDLYVYIVVWVIFSIIFPPESPRRARWVGGVRCLGQSPKKKKEILSPSLMTLWGF